MKTVLLVIGFLLLADALFTWANFERFKKIAERFPRINLKFIALIEIMLGLIFILLSL